LASQVVAEAEALEKAADEKTRELLQGEFKLTYLGLRPWSPSVVLGVAINMQHWLD
jgi:hypothetical protein